MFFLIGPYAQKLQKNVLKASVTNIKITGKAHILNPYPAANSKEHTTAVMIEFLIFNIDRRKEFLIISLTFKLTNTLIEY